MTIDMPLNVLRPPTSASVAARYLRMLTLLCALCLTGIARAQPADDQATSDDLFFFRPDTPSRLVRGAVLAERLDRPSLAQGYLQELIDSQPSPEQLLALRSEFGIGTFLRLSARESLLPVSRELLNLINQATTQDPLSANTVELLIPELGQSDQQTRQASLRILTANAAAVEPLLAADQSTRSGQLAALLLEKHARRLRHGLLKALSGADENRQVRILNLLSLTAAPELVPDLLRYQFAESASVAEAAADTVRQLLPDSAFMISSAAEAADVLVDQALNYVTVAGHPFPQNTDRLREQGLAQRLALEAAPDVYGAAFLKRAVQLVTHAAAIEPNSDRVSAALLVCELTEQSWPVRWPDQLAPPAVTVADAPAPAAADVDALKMALGTDNAGAVLSLLMRQDSAMSILQHHPELVRECQLSGDPRVRLLTAALARAAGVSNTFGRQTIETALTGSDRPEAVVIDSRSGETATAAAVLNDLKYVVGTARSGQRGYEAATSQLNCELILVHSNCLRWSLSDTVANLRADYRTRNTPIVIYGPERNEAATAFLRSTTDGVWFFLQPVSELTFPDQLRLADVTPPRLSSEERAAMLTYVRQLR
ncbi:MAG: hypothetical protein RIK87_15145 [Fuerstiella sp.]